ncbi:MAG: DUF4126 domain-containing protein [Gammaproteobacteria bacterium]|nr:DUF4126 domain-containing protein [Gammaproteobacteria bacterium]
MQSIETIALVMGVAWASGINLYAAIATLGAFGLTGHIDLPPNLEVLSNPLVLAAAGLMYSIEFVTDKVPGLDTLWDAIHTFIRIPAAVVLSASAIGDVSPALTIAAGLVGGSLATASHATKAGSRVIINTSPEPVSNWTVSLGEDVAVFTGLWVALNYPAVFLALLAIMILLMTWLLPKLWKGIKQLWQVIRSVGYRTPLNVVTAENQPETLISPTVTKLKQFDTKHDQ